MVRELVLLDEALEACAISRSEEGVLRTVFVIFT
jgi:hypothetical protein